MRAVFVMAWTGLEQDRPYAARAGRTYLRVVIEPRLGSAVTLGLTCQAITSATVPSVLDGSWSGRLADQHLLADLGGVGQIRGLAPDVVVLRTTDPAHHGQHLSEVHRYVPGCLVAAVPCTRSTAWTIAVRERAAITVFPSCDRGRTGVNVGLYASIVHTWTVLGQPLTELEHGRLKIARLAAEPGHAG
jgi:hypothetical protein